VYSTTRAAFLDLRAQDPARAGIDPLGDWLGGYLDRYGHEFDDEILNGQWSIDLLPARIQLPLPVPRVPVRYTPYNGPSIAPDWVLRPPEKPRVCLTPGASFGVDSGYLPVRTVLDSLADLDVEVLATFDPDELPASEVPANTTLTGFVPLHTLLPSCSVTVNHGGYGSWITAAYYGVPQFLLPIRYGDLMPVAHNLRSAGAALFEDGATADAQQVRDGVLRLLSEPSFADDAGALRAEIMSTPSAAEIVPRLERLTIAHHSDRSLV
jgi:UDP:flavonoid glycosyltransferase YjiC (YdhE family)